MFKVRFSATPGLGLTALASLLTAASVLGVVMPSPIAGQTVSYQLGYSNSWAERNVTSCVLDDCGPGWVHTHKDLNAPMAGVSLTYGKHAPWWLETGFLATRKGWQVTAPTLDSWAIEVPAVLHVGFRPRGSGLGASIGGGAAFDAALMQPLQSRPHAMAVAQVYGSPGGRSLWSAGVRVTRGLFTNYSKYVHSVTWFVSVSPTGFSRSKGGLED